MPKTFAPETYGKEEWYTILHEFSVDVLPSSPSLALEVRIFPYPQLDYEEAFTSQNQTHSRLILIILSIPLISTQIPPFAAYHYS